MSCCGCLSFLRPAAQPRAQKATSRHISTSYLKLTAFHHGDVKFEDQYEMSSSILGAGAFGEVRLCIHRDTKQERVVKRMAKAQIADQGSFMDELTIQADLDHPHICRIFDCYFQQDFIILVLESCRGGDLSDALLDMASFTEGDARHFMTQVLMAVNYMHHRCICHRDLKPENFLLKEKGVPHKENELKVVDFGFSRDFEPGHRSMRTKCGTPDYLAPEIMYQDSYDEKCDIWSCGVILYSFLSGDVPFVGSSVNEIMLKARKRPRFDDPVWNTVSKTARVSIVQMLHREPDVRPSAEKALQGVWFTSAGGNQDEVKEIAVDTGVVLERLRRFRTWGKFQRAVAHLVTHALPDSFKAEMHATFEALDSNSDGQLSLAELRKGMAGHDIADVDELFREMDSSKTGFVSWSDFLSALASRAMLSSEAACRQAFQAMDADGSGSISLEELRNLFATREDSSVDSLEFAKFDKNGDGMIDFDEFREVMQNIIAVQAQRSGPEDVKTVVAGAKPVASGLVCGNAMLAMKSGASMLRA